MRNKVKERRLELKLAQEKLARIIDCSTSTIQKIENTNHEPGIYLAIKLKRALQVENVEELFILEDSD